MNRREFCNLGLAGVAASAVTRAQTSARDSAQPPSRLVLDLVYPNPGEAPPETAFLDPRRLAEWGYTGQVTVDAIESAPIFNSIAPGLLSAGSPERQWAEQRAEAIERRIQDDRRAGIKSYAWMQLIVLPKAIVARFRGQICDAQGRIDITLPKTRELVRAQLREIFTRFPALDGLVIRTGEIYLHDLPYHASTIAAKQDPLQSNTAIIHGEESHIALLKVLREEACVNFGKTVIYRTWDFGDFHVKPTYYLAVTSAIDPHPNLIFSIKHQAGDFHQITPFNPTLTIGKHRQIVEVQCQREGYGKGAHPYYVGQGVIEGWEEYAWLMKPGEPKGLADIIRHPLIAGVWTWSRGGGWEGPYIRNEIWCALNTYVISKYAENPDRTELEIFEEYSRTIGLKGPGDLRKFRELNLLSTKAVLRGQLTCLNARINVWWARDNFLAAPDLGDFIRKGLVAKALAEKAEAVRMWKRIEELAPEIAFAGRALRNFVITSATYGRIKYSIIEQAWTILFYGRIGDASGQYDKGKLRAAIEAYDRLWAQWRFLKETNEWCPTLYKDKAFQDKPGIGAAVDRYRAISHVPAKA